MKHIFVTGIGTEVGKTVASAIITEALEADYFKPIQAGDLENSDTHKVEKLISNTTTKFHQNAYALKTPMSPHAAAAIDEVDIKAENIKRPQTNNEYLVVEGAGGLLVPLNSKETIADLMKKEDEIIVISRHYLGSINHTLLTIEALKSRGLTCSGIIFSGEEHPTTEAIIEEMAKVPILGRIDQEPYFDENVVKEYAELFRKKLKSL